VIRPEDDLLHPGSSDPAWTETGWFSFAVPERGLNGFVYVYHRTNVGISAGGPGLFDGNGDETHNCVYWGVDPAMPTPDDVGMFDFSLPNGLSMETIELQKRYRIRYERYDCRLDLTWEALTEPHEMVREAEKPNPSFRGWWSDDAKKVTTGHFEQVGRMRGTVVVEGETYQVDCFGLRDRTWSPRILTPMRLSYDWAIASETHCFFAPAMSPIAGELDPVYGTTEKVTAGWYIKDGLKGNLVSGERRVTERDTYGCPTVQLIEATDEHGRTLRAEGRAVSTLKWTGYAEWICLYSLAQWTLDGIVASGEMQEYFDFRMSRCMHQRSQALATQ